MSDDCVFARPDPVLHQLKISGVPQWVSPGVPKLVKENPYRNINAVLGKLGINSSPVAGHNNHFHIYLRPPAPLVDGHFLVAEAAALDSVSGIANQDVAINAQALLAQYNATLAIGEDIVFTLDVPAVSVQLPAITLAQAASPAPGASPLGKLDYQLNACQETEQSDPQSAMRGVDPAGMLWYALGSFGNAKERRLSQDEVIRATKVSLVSNAKHGNLFPEVDNEGLTSFHYDPNPGFVGDDQATFLAEYAGKNYKIVLNLKVFSGVKVFPGSPDCPFPTLIKLKSKGVSIDATDPNGITVAVADLPNSSLAKTTGTGKDAQITLDDNAAGHGWYVDYTPYLNEDFLPTSNPLEWIAKPGSEAEGKMDLLTVLLHEYGHAMGLEHTADTHDLMATTVLPGVRRLPSASEWQALRGHFYSGDGTPVPHDPFSPPGAPLPVSRGLGTLRTTRQRPSGLAGEGGLTRFDIAANPTLENPGFTGDTGWSTEGDVAFANGAATLKETAANQTRLNQAFVIGPNDRFLSFTLAGVALDDVNGAPDDAFEVALIDASTGQSLLAGTGLTHNDAFLNLQADGSEYKASGVTTVTNPDGSRTVLVDLAGVPAGTGLSP